MNKFPAFVFFAIAQEVESTRSGAYMLANSGVQEIPELIRQQYPSTLRSIIQHCKATGLTEAVPHIERMLEKFDGKFGGYDCARLASDSQDLQWRLVDEMQKVLFMRMPKDRAVFYDNSTLFGQDVADKFPNAIYDISEAGSCYATDRYTACVMHLMRALEVALDAIGLGVGISNAAIEAHNSWERLLRAISDQIKANDNTGDVAWPSKRQFFVDTHAHLFSVKNAWRNPSMHLEKKYDDKEALRIYNAVKGFMEHLATHLEASGQFTP